MKTLELTDSEFEFLKQYVEQARIGNSTLEDAQTIIDTLNQIKDKFLKVSVSNPTAAKDVNVNQPVS